MSHETHESQWRFTIKADAMLLQVANSECVCDLSFTVNVDYDHQIWVCFSHRGIVWPRKSWDISTFVINVTVPCFILTDG